MHKNMQEPIESGSFWSALLMLLSFLFMVIGFVVPVQHKIYRLLQTVFQNLTKKVQNEAKSFNVENEQLKMTFDWDKFGAELHSASRQAVNVVKTSEGAGGSVAICVVGG